MDNAQKPLGEILISRHLISEENLQSALQEQKRTKEFLGKILVRHRYIKESDLLKALSEQFNLSLGSLKNKYIDWELIKQFSPSLILDHKCIPIRKDEWSVTIGTNNPLDVWAMKKAEDGAMGLAVKFVLLPEEDIDEVIVRYKQHNKGNVNSLFKNND